MTNEGEPPADDGEADGHRHAEDRRLRRTRRHLLFSIGAVALFAVAFLAVYVWSPRRDVPPSPTPQPSPSPTVVASRFTVLLQASTDDGAVGNMLTAVQPSGQASGQPAGSPQAVLLSLPHDLVVAAPGAEEQPLATTVASFDTLRPSSAVAATLGVHVDAAWRLDRKALAGLVDSVNGVTVDVTRRMRIRDEMGQPIVTLRPGLQRLSGTTASWYAVGDVAGDSDLDQADRFADVLTKTLARLPNDDLAIRESLTALGTLAPSTIATQDLATYLDELGNAIRARSLTATTVPTTPVLLGPVALRWTDFAAATPLLRRTLPGSLWRAGVDGPPRALVRVPEGRSGWLGYARNTLAGSGFVFVDGRGTSGSVRRTAIQVRGDPAWAQQLARLLAIPRSSTTVVPIAAGKPPVGRPWADADVSLGPTYVPGVGDPRVSASASASAPATPGRSGRR